jgi:hypothetical protein
MCVNVTAAEMGLAKNNISLQGCDTMPLEQFDVSGVVVSPLSGSGSPR